MELSNAAELSAEIILYRIPHKSKGLICRIPYVESQIGWGKGGKSPLSLTAAQAAINN